MMRLIGILILVFSSLFAGCSSARIKKCVSKYSEPNVYHCPQQADGLLRWCDKPQDIYSCEDP